ncbi:MAG: hypothetical protein AB8G05_24355 [Oligoflexales bacterium]
MWFVQTRNLKTFSDTSLDSLLPRALLVHTIMDQLQIEKVEFHESNGSTLGILNDFSFPIVP